MSDSSGRQLRYPKPEDRFSPEELRSYQDAKNARKRKRRRRERVEKLKAEIESIDGRIEEIDSELMNEQATVCVASNEDNSGESLSQATDSGEESKELVLLEKADPMGGEYAAPIKDEAENLTLEPVEPQSISVESGYDKVRCTARNFKGEQCKQWACFGTNVCKYHGGNAKQVREKARVRAAYLADDAMARLSKIAFDENKPAKVQLDAIKHLILQAGVTPPTQVEVGPIRPYETIFDDISTERPNYTVIEGDSTSVDEISTERAGIGFDTSAESLRESVAHNDSVQSNTVDGSDVTHRHRDARERASNPVFDYEEPSGRDDYDRLESSQTAEQHELRPWERPDLDGRERARAENLERYRPGLVTGEDAIWLANKANRVGGDYYDMPSRPMMDYIDAKYPRRTRDLPPGW